MWYLVALTLWIVVSFINGNPLQSLHPETPSRIIGGEDAPEGFAPYMTALVLGDRIKSMTCGGSIVTRRHVFTAAHCLYYLLSHNGELPPTYHGVVGSNKWNSGGAAVYFSQHHIHEDWDEQLIKDDIAVLVTAEELVLSEKVAVIAMGFDYVEGGRACFVTGWGATGPRIEDNVVHLAPTPDDLQLLHVETVTPSRCIQEMNAQQLTTPHPIDAKREICAFHSKGHGMCNGDSGSALVLEETRQLIGVVSWGMPCAQGLSDVFVRVSAYKDFIMKHMAATFVA